jgi:hypothetical protein
LPDGRFTYFTPDIAGIRQQERRVVVRDGPQDQQTGLTP